jgi:UDP-N-acetylmuramyl tripeptide synthase
MSDTWYQVMCNMMDVENPILGGIYCVLMILIGQFFLLNLILAVIIYSFIKSQKENLAAEIRAYQQEEKARIAEEERLK